MNTVRMFANRLRLLYSVTHIKPAVLVPPCNTRLTRHFCTENKRELKPEDTFGTYVTDVASRYPADHCEDEPKGTHLSVLEALQEIKNFVDKQEFDKAYEVFMEFKKTKKPPPHMYKLLFACAARLGKAEEAFKIYNDLKKRALYADGAMYTSLFYTCAKCPRSDMALRIANKLLEDLFKSRKFKPNKSNFNAIMMAYGRHGDITRVMLLVDKLEEQGMPLSCRNYNFAMESCIFQRNAGLRFAVLIWHHMLRKKIKPDSYTFAILGRCVRDCSLGDSELTDEFIKSVFKKYSRKTIDTRPEVKLNSGELTINMKEDLQPLLEADRREGDAEESSSITTSDESKTSDGVSAQPNGEAELEKSADCSIIDAENDEIQRRSHSMAMESSNDCGLDGETGGKSLSTTYGEVADADKAVVERVNVSVAMDGSEVADADKAVVERVNVSVAMDGSEVADADKAVVERVDEHGAMDEREVADLLPGVELSGQEETHRFNDEDLPNLLTLKPPGKSIVNFGDFSTPQNRLMLFGGFQGFLKTMDKYKAKPDIVLFSMLLSCVPSKAEDEEALMKEMRERKVRVDTTFLNILIRKRIIRKVDCTIEDFMDLFEKHRCHPDAVTIGTIARSCVTHESGMKCIQLARSHNIRLNTVILGCLLENARKTSDIDYVSDILKAGKEDDTELDMRFASTLKSIVENEKRKRKQANSSTSPTT